MTNQGSIRTETKNLKQLRSLFESQVFALPRLQREFVWSATKARDLVDSVYRGYPIGNVTIWQARRRREFEFRKRRNILPPYDDHNPYIYFIIDGQQRLSCLWQLLRGDGHVVQNASGQQIDFGKIYFYVGTPGDRATFVYRRRRPPKDYVPVVTILSSRWHSRTKHLGKRAQTRIRYCRERLLDYRVFLTFLETSDLEQVQESFIRINSLGTKISTADRAFARASDVGLRDLVHGVTERMEAGFGAISSGTILQTAAFVMEESDIGERSINRVARNLEKDEDYRKKFFRYWRRLRHSFGYAADYLAMQFGVVDHTFLPSDYLVSVLALYFFHKRNTRPTKKAVAELRKWFWATVVGARYTGRGFRPNVTADAEFMRRLASGRARFVSPRDVPTRVIRYADYSRRGMVTDGYFCLLRLQSPAYLEDGEPIPRDAYSTRANRSDKHHIFPRGLLRRHGYSASDCNLLPNICFLVARENQSIGSKHPLKYLDTVDGVSHNLRTRNRALRTHLIPYGTESGLWDKNVRRGYRNFLDQRTALIAKEFERQAGDRLFRQG